MLGFRARYQNRRTDDKIHSPKFLMASDVLRRSAACPRCERIVIAAHFIRVKFAFWMGVNKGPVAVEREHQQQLGIHAWRGNIFRAETRDSRTQNLFELHMIISPHEFEKCGRKAAEHK